MRSPTVPASVIAQIDQHVRSDLQREVGGILVGRIDGETSTVIAALPALRAVAGSANITFTHEVWDDVLNEVDREYPDDNIVGWYHSHPGFGVFLSEYDLFIHRNFFPHPAMAALVVDPLRGEAGWFAGTEEIAQVGSFSVEAAQPPSAQPVLLAARRTTRRTGVLVAAALAVAGFGVGWALAPDGAQDVDERLGAAEQRAASAEEQAAVASDRAADAEARAAQLADELREIAGTPPEVPTTTTVAPPAELPPVFAVIHTVESGDSLWSIATRFYGDGSRWVEIAEANDLDGSEIDTGQELTIPGVIRETALAGASTIGTTSDA